LYSGAASVILAMYVFRRIYRLEAYLEPLHFRNLGLLLLALTMLYLYFNINEYLTVGYMFPGHEKTLFDRLFFTDYAPYFWGVQTLGVLIPMLLLMAVLGPKGYRRFTIEGVVLASALVVAGAWAKRYLIIVPTLGSPYLPIQGLPWEWAHYRPTWVEWSITAAAFAGFLLIYTILAKVFPIVSIWETREGEMVEVRPESAPQPSPPVWRPIPSISVLLIVGVLAASGVARADDARAAKKPQPTAITVEWQTLAPTQPPSSEEATHSGTSDSPRVYFFADRLFGPLNYQAKPPGEDKPIPTIAVNATLRDHKGRPMAFQAVEFALKTSLGTIKFGNRPTDQAGQAKVLIRERRYGQYPVTVAYSGDDLHAVSRGETLVDFGPRPAPALPAEGVLIAPYATPAIGIPFLVFYGIMWVVYVCAFGYLVLWRMRRSSPVP
ncbi:MAG: hypothetical protein HYS33_00535, partial [Acidobacteria bacterium]|nr:hypothetical protein [Acidobacteriota bacterium]